MSVGLVGGGEGRAPPPRPRQAVQTPTAQGPVRGGWVALNEHLVKNEPGKGEG